MRSLTLLPMLTLLTLACGGSGEVPVGAAEREVILDAADLAPHFSGLVVDASRETWAHHRDWDGSYEIQYDYHSPKGDPNVLYLSTSVSVQPNASDGSSAYTAAGLGVLVVGLASLTLVETPGLLTWGDAQSCQVVLSSNGTSVGAICRAHKGARVYTVILIGFDVDQPGSMDALLATQLAAFELWNPAF